ncbi:MAG: CAP domain-containing protein, partial [Anaerolineae bacterium]
MRGLYPFGLVILLAAVTLAPVRAQSGYDPASQTAFLQYQEARTVYLGNLARRENGVPPLRWNRPLTHAARWFSWDSTENRPPDFCGHQDSQGGWPGDRARRFGYLGSAGAENAFCGYVTPEYAIQGWMNSPGHRANLLDPNHREVGLGYYRRQSDGRGYVTQDFGRDPAYAPVVIENEAISTTNPTVNLYIHDRPTGGGFAGLGPAVQMMLGEDPCIADAAWEPYRPERTWTFSGGSGWRSIYVKTRDAFSRTLTVSDTIYLGANVPLDQLDTAAAPLPQSQVTLYGLDGGPFPSVQFSLGWLADDTFETFNKWWGNGERVSDPSAWGGTAYRLYPGDGESFAWVWDTTFPVRDVSLVAYFRLKVNDNTSTSEVARISVRGGDREYGPLSLRGTDFAARNQYQEFALPFTFHPTDQHPFLIFQFWRSGTADLYVDAVSIFTAPQAATSPLTWTVPGGNYRGQGIWARYTDGTHF